MAGLEALAPVADRAVLEQLVELGPGDESRTFASEAMSRVILGPGTSTRKSWMSPRPRSSSSKTSLSFASAGTSRWKLRIAVSIWALVSAVDMGGDLSGRGSRPFRRAVPPTTLAACRRSPVWWGCSPSRRCCSSAPPGCRATWSTRITAPSGGAEGSSISYETPVGTAWLRLRRPRAGGVSADDGRFVYEARPTRGESSGSWPRFLAALLRRLRRCRPRPSPPPGRPAMASA